MRSVLFVVALGFVSACGGAPAADAKKPLYWRDPMHPSYTSDRPGKAPDCGMDLEPVYAESPAPETAGVVTVGKVERGSVERTLRTIGRVAPDESRVYPVVAGCEGWITRLEQGTAAGDRVRKGQALAIVNGRDLGTAERTFLYALKAAENPPPSLPGDEGAPALTLQEARRNLENLGFGEAQIAELQRTRQVSLDVALVAPASGVVLSRSAYPRQRFERDTELFRIADLTRVWVMADLPSDGPGDVPAGTAARVIPSGRTGALPAVVGGALPRFDPSSRVAKIRLEADNPGLSLAPDMTVDVELALAVPDVTTVPATAVLDGAGGKQVFVDVGGGRYEPRPVRVGRRFGDRVEIESGVATGETIVVSGAFLLEAERRLHRD
ncbi:MAG TPA: efflux RND transporter periplasmic adaptor subunit [Candidatus Polarisedimenticolaceae bacterium]|nr:efflux RND transporter periplasmic adaptor subunit [Candidatus Polarisedimenticolaceae bacterium]